jgi:hypothetical protein
MGLEPTFTQAAIRSRMDKFIAVIEKRQIERLQYLGEECVKIAREIPASVGFTDQTGNLRSSIGYVVFKNGIAIHEGYQGTSEGIQSGKSLAEKVGKSKQGVALIVTAGMNYAIYLESNGRDVLTSAEIHAKQELPKMLDALKKNINKALL